MGHWYPCFRASFYTMPEWATASEGSPVTAALVLGMVLVYPLYLACHLVFAAVWLVVGCFLHLTRILTFRRIREYWVQVWVGGMHPTAKPTTTAAVDSDEGWLYGDAHLVAVFVALPELILQLHNQREAGFTTVGIISVVASGLGIAGGIAGAAAVKAETVGPGNQAAPSTSGESGAGAYVLAVATPVDDWKAVPSAPVATAVELV
jgi:hypothetical protein